MKKFLVIGTSFLLSVILAPFLGLVFALLFFSEDIFHLSDSADPTILFLTYVSTIIPNLIYALAMIFLGFFLSKPAKSHHSFKRWVLHFSALGAAFGLIALFFPFTMGEWMEMTLSALGWRSLWRFGIAGLLAGLIVGILLSRLWYAYAKGKRKVVAAYGGLALILLFLAIADVYLLPDILARRSQVQSRNAKGSIVVISEALEEYKLDHRTYPTLEQWLHVLLLEGYLNTSNRIGNAWSNRLLDPWGNPYQYANPGTHGEPVDVWSFGPDEENGTEDDIVSWSDQ